MLQFDQLTEHVCTATLTGRAEIGFGGTSKEPTDCDHIVAPFMQLGLFTCDHDGTKLNGFQSNCQNWTAK